MLHHSQKRNIQKKESQAIHTSPDLVENQTTTITTTTITTPTITKTTPTTTNASPNLRTHSPVVTKRRFSTLSDLSVPIGA